MRKFAIALLAALPLATAVYAETRDDAVDVRAAMVNEINPATLAVWKVSNAAIDDKGAIDPAKMDDAAWADLIDAAEQLGKAAERLAQAKAVIAAGPDNLPAGNGEEGRPAMHEIQGYIDSDFETFREEALVLSDVAAVLGQASRLRDDESVSMMVEEMNFSCESCHKQFWYPSGF